MELERSGNADSVCFFYLRYKTIEYVRIVQTIRVWPPGTSLTRNTVNLRKIYRNPSGNCHLVPQPYRWLLITTVPYPFFEFYEGRQLDLLREVPLKMES